MCIPASTVCAPAQSNTFCLVDFCGRLTVRPNGTIDRKHVLTIFLCISDTYRDKEYDGVIFVADANIAAFSSEGGITGEKFLERSEILAHTYTDK